MVAFDVSVLARSLIGKMEIHDFNREVRENRAARFEAALEPEQLDQLYNLSKIESLLKSEVVPSLPIDIFHDGHLMRLADLDTVHRTSSSTSAGLRPAVLKLFSPAASGRQLRALHVPREDPIT